MTSLWIGAAVVGALAAWIGLMERPSAAKAEDFHTEVDPGPPASDLLTISKLMIPGPKGSALEAWLCMPRQKPLREGQRPPVVIMGHGFGLQKDFGLVPFAEAFARRGLATLLFDYRHFGGSTGLPRHLLDPWKQLEDWRAVIEYTSTTALDGAVDASRIGLAGSSYSGGHVTALLADEARLHPAVRCGAANVPYLSSLPVVALTFQAGGYLRTGLYFARLMLHAVRDALQNGVFGRRAHYIPIAGGLAELAALASPSSRAGYLGLVPEQPRGGWQNAVCARIALKFVFYSPGGVTGGSVKRVARPLLFTCVEGDDLTFAEPVRNGYRKRENAPVEMLELESQDGHWAAYYGREKHVEASEAICKFLATHLEQ